MSNKSSIHWNTYVAYIELPNGWTSGDEAVLTLRHMDNKGFISHNAKKIEPGQSFKL